jgi:hypothetical protein
MSSIVRIIPAHMALLVAMLFTPVMATAVSAQSRDSVWLASKGYFIRRATGDGILFRDAGELAVYRGRNLSDALRGQPGVVLRRTLRGAYELRLAAEERDGDCAVDVFVNGSLVDLPRAHDGVPIDAVARPLAVTAFELHGAETSPVAAEGEACGHLLIWSARLRSVSEEPFIGMVRGRAVDAASGRGVRGVRVRMIPGEHEVVSDESGAFTIASVTPAYYSVTAEVEGYPRWSSMLRVRAFGTTSLELRLEQSSAQPIRSSSASTCGSMATGSIVDAMAVSGSLSPWPVSTQTQRWSGSTRPLRTARRRAATLAAEAGSQKTPSSEGMVR